MPIPDHVRHILEFAFGIFGNAGVDYKNPALLGLQVKTLLQICSIKTLGQNIGQHNVLGGCAARVPDLELETDLVANFGGGLAGGFLKLERGGCGHNNWGFGGQTKWLEVCHGVSLSEQDRGGGHDDHGGLFGADFYGDIAWGLGLEEIWQLEF